MLSTIGEQQKQIPFRQPKIALRSIFLPFYLTEKHQICIVYQKTFLKKNCIKEQLCKESTEKKLCVIPHIHRKKTTYFYKNSANQTFTNVSSKVVYFKNHHRPYQVQHSQEKMLLVQNGIKQLYKTNKNPLRNKIECNRFGSLQQEHGQY